jgi:hypothetical protein
MGLGVRESARQQIDHQNTSGTSGVTMRVRIGDENMHPLAGYVIPVIYT